MPADIQKQSRSRSHDKHKKRKRSSSDPEENAAPASRKKHKKSHRDHSRDRDKDRKTKKLKRDHKEKKRRNNWMEETKRKMDEGKGLLGEQTEIKGQAQCKDGRVNQDELFTATKGVEKFMDHQIPADCRQVAASVIGQIRVSDQTRRRIAEGVCHHSIDADNAKSDGNDDVQILSGHEDKRERRRSPSPRRHGSASCRSKGSSDKGHVSSLRSSVRGSRRQQRDSRSRSSSGSRRSVDSDASDLSVKRGSSGGRLKIDRERLRRRALENTVLRLDERCPRKLADMPCFKALGVRVSELEKICRRLAPSRQPMEKAGAAATSSASVAELPHQGGSKDCGKRLHQPQETASLDPASSVCTSSTAVRHPFQLRSETSGVSSGVSLLSLAPGDKSVAVNKLQDKKELLSAFPVSSGEFHRHQDNISALALTAPSQVDNRPSSVSSSSAGILIKLTQSRLTPVAYDQPPLPPWVPVASNGSNPTTTQVAPQAASAVEQHRVLQLGDWATAKLLAAKTAPQTPLQLHLQHQQRSKSPQAWVTKHQFECARPITGGIGRQLMEKMGWRHGQGLGKRNEGPTEPLAIDYKTDRKGLASQEDKRQQLQQSKKKKNKPGAIAASAAAASNLLVQQLGGKHPVSILMELTKQRRWPDPMFRQVDESGPPHDRCFVFCVCVFGVEYQPDRPSKNKKDAKASAATLALQKLGILTT